MMRLVFGLLIAAPLALVPFRADHGPRDAGIVGDPEPNDLGRGPLAPPPIFSPLTDDGFSLNRASYGSQYHHADKADFEDGSGGWGAFVRLGLDTVPPYCIHGTRCPGWDDAIIDPNRQWDIWIGFESTDSVWFPAMNPCDRSLRVPTVIPEITVWRDFAPFGPGDRYPETVCLSYQGRTVSNLDQRVRIYWYAATVKASAIVSPSIFFGERPAYRSGFAVVPNYYADDPNNLVIGSRPATVGVQLRVVPR